MDTLPSPQDLHAKLNQMLWDAGCRDRGLVQVISAPVGGHARYVVSIVRGEARFTLADALERILQRPLVGVYWVFCLDEVQTITAAQQERIR